MRSTEWINVVYFFFLGSLACARPLEGPRRRRILLLGSVGLLATLAGRWSGLALGAEPSRILRDWLPAPILLFAYWQAGQFYTEPWPRLQAWLESVDRSIFGRLDRGHDWLGNRAVAGYLEGVYLGAYLLVPLGLVVLKLTGFADQADRFWTLVLLSSYSCYIVLPFAPTLPPRLKEQAVGYSTPATPVDVRVFNLWLLKHLGIPANTFPSAHVASAGAAALVVLDANLLAGALFLWLAASIALSAAALRYHFFADIVLGALLAVGYRVLLG